MFPFRPLPLKKWCNSGRSCVKLRAASFCAGRRCGATHGPLRAAPKCHAAGAEPFPETSFWHRTDGPAFEAKPTQRAPKRRPEAYTRAKPPAAPQLVDPQVGTEETRCEER